MTRQNSEKEKEEKGKRGEETRGVNHSENMTDIMKE
jgi:hypothetical protein